jgi:AP-4 complex subunit epsilon-1
MQRDLQSANVLECSGGLLAATSLITSDMVPAVSTEVVKLLAHDSPTIRKKAVVALQRFHQLAPDVVTKEEMQSQLRKVLCDKDPSVMGSCLNVIQWMARTDPLPFKELVPSLVSILKQIGDHRLPTDYDYHRVPAPWMQIQLVRILGILGRGDVSSSEGMYQVLRETMKNADNGINAGYAISYECIKTIVSIYPNPALLDSAADAISRVRAFVRASCCVPSFMFAVRDSRCRMAVRDSRCRMDYSGRFFRGRASRNLSYVNSFVFCP